MSESNPPQAARGPDEKSETELILASASPRRRELLVAAGLRFRVVSSGVEEDAPAASSEPHELARTLAARKARAAAVLIRDSSDRCCVLGADTVVALSDGRLLGKPAGRDEAVSHLRALSGTTHRVITGVCLIDLPSGREDLFHVETRVTMRRLDPVDIDDYVESGAGFDKAGGYAIQEGGDRFVTQVAGSWSNVVGLPVEETVARLRLRGIGRP